MAPITSLESYPGSFGAYSTQPPSEFFDSGSFATKGFAPGLEAESSFEPLQGSSTQFQPTLSESRSFEPSGSSSQSIHDLIAQYVSAHVGEYGEDQAPGIAVGLVTDQERLALGFGTQKAGEHIAVDGDTLFGIGSVSKIFTALILAKAVADGDLKLTQKLNDFLDESIQIDERITLQHLVTHRSGLPNFPTNMETRDNVAKDPIERQMMPAKNYSKANLVACLRQNGCRPMTPPGASSAYSNLGIGMLSIALQNHYHYQNSGELIQSLITQPLQMTSTCMNTPACLDGRRGSLAQGYRYDQQNDSLTPVPLSDMGILAGSGGLISNAKDMNRLLSVLTGLSGGGLVSAAAEMNREIGQAGEDQADSAIGYAHRIKHTPRGFNVHSKAGFVAGYTAVIIWLEDPKVGLVLLANRGNLKGLIRTGMRLMASILQQRHPAHVSGMGSRYYGG
ncbi:serine hydrolase domain-containing protein [Thiorhodovibrio winogradskyi]|nr:serine hydrolase domain-containing protein [Thiorhodovibrio winogradskyi]